MTNLEVKQLIAKEGLSTTIELTDEDLTNLKIIIQAFWTDSTIPRLKPYITFARKLWEKIRDL